MTAEKLKEANELGNLILQLNDALALFNKGNSCRDEMLAKRICIQYGNRTASEVLVLPYSKHLLDLVQSQLIVELQEAEERFKNL